MVSSEKHMRLSYFHAHEHENTRNGQITTLCLVLSNILTQRTDGGPSVLVHLRSVDDCDSFVGASRETMNEVIERKTD